jgi:hypothetical protein
MNSLSLPLSALSTSDGIMGRHLNTDRLSLQAHIRACDRAKGWAFTLQSVGERLHGVVAPRFVTTVFMATVLMIVVSASA